VTPTVAASLLPTRRFLLSKGAFSIARSNGDRFTLPGKTHLHHATDTFSADGTVVLLERGTKLVGKRAVDVRPRATRIFRALD